MQEALVMDDESLENIAAVALQRIRASLERGAPFMAQRVRTWMESLWPGHSLEEYWTHPIGFPLLLAPWWLEETLRRKSDSSFQLELIYSAINMYYQIRLTDNVMDGDVPTDRTLLPALGFFHTEFQRPYHRYFGHEHPFWEYFSKVWFHSAEVTMLDGSMSDFDSAQFREIAGQKTCAATIPVAAVCYRYDRTDVLPAWSRFLERYGWWSQMSNDTFDWLKDSQHNAGTFFLSEARRRKHPDESVTEWVIREGFEWAMETLETWMSELRALSRDLQSPAIMEHLDMRAAALAKKKANFSEGLRSLSELRSAFNGNR
jgi:hypothetical protein